MVRRRSTVRFRNGAQVDGLIRKDSNASWVLVGPNGCHQDAGSPYAACSERRGPQGTSDTGAAREVWSAPGWCRDHVSGPGAADRLGPDPGQPGGAGAARVPTAGACGAGSVPGAGEIPAIRRHLSARAALVRCRAGRSLVRRALQG